MDAKNPFLQKRNGTHKKKIETRQSHFDRSPAMTGPLQRLTLLLMLPLWARGDCVWYGNCGVDPAKNDSKELPCQYSGPASKGIV